MEIPNTIEMEKLQDAAASLAIENMYPNRAFLEEMIKVANGKKSHEELRQEIIKKHARQ